MEILALHSISVTELALACKFQHYKFLILSSGTYKCPQSTECVSVYCNATGTCVEEFLPENTPCGSGNFCDERCATDTDPQNPFGLKLPWQPLMLRLRMCSYSLGLY